MPRMKADKRLRTCVTRGKEKKKATAITRARTIPSEKSQHLDTVRTASFGGKRAEGSRSQPLDRTMVTTPRPDLKKDRFRRVRNVQKGLTRAPMCGRKDTNG